MSGAVNPNFPSFNPIHLPQMIAVGNSAQEARAYAQHLSSFGKIKPPTTAPKESLSNTSQQESKDDTPSPSIAKDSDSNTTKSQERATPGPEPEGVREEVIVEESTKLERSKKQK